MTTARTYGGVPAEQRRADRRDRLLAAAIAVVGRDGWQRTTVRAVCREAKLTERYFYEAFGDREALLEAAFDRVVEEVTLAILAAVAAAPHDAEARARAAIGTFVDLVAADPARARVMLVEATGSDALHARRQAVTAGFARLVRDQAAVLYGVAPEGVADAELTAHALIGGLGQLIVAWLSGEVDVPRDRLVAHCTALFVQSARVSSG